MITQFDLVCISITICYNERKVGGKMDINKLKSFLVLSECKSFTKTADILYCSQPAISKHIDSLESELQVPLFNRSRSKVSLTIQGKHFKQYAESIVRQYENSKEHIRQIEDINQGSLYFGSTNFIGIYLMPKFLKKFQDLYPEININMTVKSSKNLFDMLEKHEIEFVFLSHYVNIDKSKYISKPFFTDELVLIVKADHKLAEKDSCSLADIRDEVLITKDSYSSLYRFLGRNVEDFTFKKELIINNQEAIKHAVMEGLGVSIMSKIAVNVEEKANLIKAIRINDYDLTRDINLVYEKNRHITPAGHGFLKLLDLGIK